VPVLGEAQIHLHGAGREAGAEEERERVEAEAHAVGLTRRGEERAWG
jgi:hypothetical protein